MIIIIMFHGQNNLSDSNLSKINLLKKKKTENTILMLFKRIYKATALLHKILKFQFFGL